MVRLRARQNRLRRKTAAGGVAIFTLVAALACGRETPPPTPSPVLSQVEGPVQSLPPAAAPIASLPPVRSQVEGSEEKEGPAVYLSRGRRDPFRPPQVKAVTTPQTIHLRLTGIIRGAHSSYALVESDASPGIGYVIRENDVIDSAKVVKITKDSVVFKVQTKNSEGKLLTRYVQKHMPPAESR